MPTPHPNYHHATLSAWGFLEKSENFYQRPAGETTPQVNVIHGRGTGLYIWQRGRTWLQADAVSSEALRQVLQRELGEVKPVNS